VKNQNGLKMVFTGAIDFIEKKIFTVRKNLSQSFTQYFLFIEHRIDLEHEEKFPQTPKEM